MELQYLSQLITYNQIIKEMDDLYHNYAKSNGLSDSAFWIFYLLLENDQINSQRELCTKWFYSPQTVNSTLKGLKEQGYVEIELSPNSGKNKQILFTDKGKALAEKVILPIIRAELDVVADLGEKGREELVSLTQKYVALMRANINRISEYSSED